MLLHSWRYLYWVWRSYWLLLNNNTARNIGDKVRILWGWLYHGSGDWLTLNIFNLSDACCCDLTGFWNFYLHFLWGRLFEANLPDSETLGWFFECLLQPKQRPWVVVRHYTWNLTHAILLFLYLLKYGFSLGRGHSFEFFDIRAPRGFRRCH